MEINGLNLPATFVKDLQSGRLLRESGCWDLIENKSAYGKPLETELCDIFADLDRMQKATNDLEKHFSDMKEEDIDDPVKTYDALYGAIPYIWDFSKVICFAEAGDGSPFCFDFRENEQEPKVIWWADDFWQRVAPNYETFIRLFKTTITP